MKAWSSIPSLADAFGLDEAQADILARYADVILTWQQANVTGMKTREDVVDLLLGDALSLLDVPQVALHAEGRWVDLGAGAGIPGLPLAVALPSIRLTLLEAVARKCAFLEAAIAAIGVATRVAVVCARSERFAAHGQEGRDAFDVVLARAVAPLPVLVELASPLLRPGGHLLASKTRRAIEDEGEGGATAAARSGLAAGPVIPLPRSPLDDGVCAVYEKVVKTPASLPRREGIAAKRPLA